eukprot:2813242-Heterocapsa_arctica.AAC.1
MVRRPGLPGLKAQVKSETLTDRDRDEASKSRDPGTGSTNPRLPSTAERRQGGSDCRCIME